MVCAAELEQELQRELNDSREIRLSWRDRPEARRIAIRDLQLIGWIGIRTREERRVREVERFRAELKPLRLGDRDVLLQGQVEVRDRRLPEGRNLLRQVLQGELRQRRPAT